MRVLVIALALTACQTVDSALGPTSAELLTAIRSSHDVAGKSSQLRAIRDVRCAAFEEEPTEFSCRAMTQDQDGGWTRKTAVLATERDGWLLLSLD